MVMQQSLLEPVCPAGSISKLDFKQILFYQFFSNLMFDHFSILKINTYKFRFVMFKKKRRKKSQVSSNAHSETQRG